MQPATLQTIHSRADLPGRTLLKRVNGNIYWFVASFALCVGAGLIFLRYATANYSVTASLLLRDDSRGAEFGDAALEDLGVTTIKSSVDNEIEILRSRTLMEQVVGALQLNVQYFASGRVKTAEIYEQAPFKLKLLRAWRNKAAKRFDFNFLPEKQYYQVSASGKSIRARFGDTVYLDNHPAVFVRSRYQPAQADKYFFTINPIDAAVKQYTARLDVSATSKLASMVGLTFSDILPDRGETVLDKLIQTYLQTSLTDKQRIADSSIAFIDENLWKLSAELGTIENHIEHFRRNNRVTDLNEDRHILLENVAETSKAHLLHLSKLKIIEAFEKYLHDYPEHVVPSSFFQYESAFLDAAKRYNEMQMQRKKIALVTGDSHPIALTLDNQLNTLRTDLLAGIINQKKDLLAQFELNLSTRRNLDRDVAQLPHKERLLRERVRDQSIKQDLYVFLLKKRMETSISRSSTFSGARVIDFPKADTVPVFPNRELILLLSGFIGLAVPLLATYTHMIFDDRLLSKEQIAEYCNIPILAEISLTKRLKQLNGFDNSLLAEQFRILRTNIQFLLQKEHCKTMIITSSEGGEGKSFIAAHLAASFALTGKKVILVELDLRKPSLSAFLSLPNTGIADFLLSDQNVSGFIQKTSGHTSVEVLLAGAPLANAAEILCTPKIIEMFATLRELYDHIIIDTPPVGLVADARLLHAFSDLCLFVVRLGQTRKEQIDQLTNISQSQYFRHLHLVINGARPSSGYQYSYGYQNQRRSRFQKLMIHLKQQTRNHL